jgi:hypothetical protein
LVKALKSAKNLTEPVPVPVQSNMNDLSDSSSSSSGSEANSLSIFGSSSTTQFIVMHFKKKHESIGHRCNPLSPSTSSGSVPAGQRFISSSMFMNAMDEVLMANRRAGATDKR